MERTKQPKPLPHLSENSCAAYPYPLELLEMLARCSSPVLLLVFSLVASMSGQQSNPLASRAAVSANTVTHDKQTLRRELHVGDETCRSCHQELANSYFQTAHHLTSRPASKNSVAGPFTTGTNFLKTSDPGLSFRMDERPDGFFQTAIWGIPPVTSSRSERMDLVVGSGRKGQTYLYWKEDRLFQLPVSYWVEIDQWVNSPGYRDGTADFNRPVIPRCFECHASYIQLLAGPPPPNRYAHNSSILGISCERCHGPGNEHVALERVGGAPTPPQTAIVNPKTLTREQQIEVCAQCHAGHGTPLASPFSYVPGEPLNDYLKLDRVDPTVNIDVHGNQVALLEKSRCYLSSGAMTCSTCHDVHVSQRDAAAFSSHCLTCHKIQDCGAFANRGDKIAENCIDCHMPVQPSNLIISESNGKKTTARVRNHWIKVYSGAKQP
jgi:hypothetical protein